MIYAGIRNVGSEGGSFDPLGGLRDLLAGKVPPSRTPGSYQPAVGAGVAIVTAAAGQLPTGPVAQDQTTPVPCPGGGTIRVHRAIATQLGDLLKTAQKAGVLLCGTGWRSTGQQRALRIAHGYLSDAEPSGSRGRIPTARPGESRHEYGLAVDFTQGGVSLSKTSAGYRWLVDNAGRYGLKNLPSEPWHWSTDGH